MKSYNYPATLQLEVSDIYGQWQIVKEFRVISKHHMNGMIDSLKKYYSLHNKQHQFHIVTPSKVNDVIFYIVDDLRDNINYII